MATDCDRVSLLGSPTPIGMPRYCTEVSLSLMPLILPPSFFWSSFGPCCSLLFLAYGSVSVRSGARDSRKGTMFPCNQQARRAHTGTFTFQPCDRKHHLPIFFLPSCRACGSCGYGYRPRTSLALFPGEFGEGRECEMREICTCEMYGWVSRRP